METFSSLLRDINYVLETSGSGATPLLIAGGIVFGTGMFVTLCFLALKPLQPLFRGPQRKAPPHQHTKGVREKTLKERSSAPAGAAGGGIADRPSDASAASSADASDAMTIETAERSPEPVRTPADDARRRTSPARGPAPSDVAAVSEARDGRRAPVPLPLRPLPKRAIAVPATLAERVEPQLAAPCAQIAPPLPAPPVAAAAPELRKAVDIAPAPAARPIQPAEPEDMKAPDIAPPAMTAPELRVPLAVRAPLPRLTPRPLPRVRPLHYAPPQIATEGDVVRVPMGVAIEPRTEQHRAPTAEPTAPTPAPKPTPSARTITLPGGNAQLVRLTALRPRSLA